MSIHDIIRQRRSIFPVSYTAQEISRETIEALLENANHAPTHKLTQPWRFRVLTGDSKRQLAQVLAESYKQATPVEKFSEQKYKKFSENPLKAAAIIAIGMYRAPEETLPEWEDLAAVSMAVQNMWLTASALGLGAYWGTPAVADSEACRQFLQWSDREQGLGFLYLGYHQLPPAPAQRTPVAEKTKWL